MKVAKRDNQGIAQENLVSQLEKIVQGAKRDNTKKSYLNSVKKFQHFLTRTGMDNVSDIKSNTTAILLFLTSEAQTKKYNTVKLYFAGVKSYCIERDIPVDYAKVKLFFKGLRNEKSGSKGAMALEFPELSEIILNIDADTLIGRRDKALLIIGFYGAFRRSELIGLDISNIIETPKGLSILVEDSKTDKNKEGMHKVIPYNFENPKICPVLLLQDYLREAQIVEGAIFRSISKGGDVGGRLSGTDVYRIVKKYAYNFSAHSLRVGFITTASGNGATPQSIMLQSGHKTVQMVAHYTRAKNAWKNNAVEKIY